MARTTVVLLMPIATISKWQQQLVSQGYPHDWPVAFVSRGGTSQQRVIETTVERARIDARQHDLESPALVVVGQVVKLRRKLAWYEDSEAVLEVEAAVAQAG